MDPYYIYLMIFSPEDLSISPMSPPPSLVPSSVLIININGETQTQEIVSLRGDWHGSEMPAN